MLDTFLVTWGSHLIEFGDNMEINLTQEKFLIHPSPSIVMHGAGQQCRGNNIDPDHFQLWPAEGWNNSKSYLSSYESSSSAAIYSR